jgi:hypothetical protein
MYIYRWDALLSRDFRMATKLLPSVMDIEVGELAREISYPRSNFGQLVAIRG